ncbi:MAG: hypothetical protein ACXWC9_01875 [Pseudobdellovibrionaceae bacterium]
MKTAEEFNSRCSDFPKPFDTKLPLMLYVEMFGKGAAIKIESEGSKLKYIAFVNGEEKPYIAENYIRQICLHPDKLAVFYEGSNTPKEVFADRGKAKIDGHKFKKCDDAQFNKTANRIKEVIIGTDGPNPATGAN